ncbi:hypothetical protein [Enterobacter asburiae]|uniref:hypothetical protein n=1 Tax=Enterobacter asburiae TaxID=61645 RepID=UPI000F896C0B|nr:hypothetical protein [Enterobacter asburiae]RTP87927.1 hypothetical protein EKN34_13470 [Enterobacter asburiae]
MKTLSTTSKTAPGQRQRPAACVAGGILCLALGGFQAPLQAADSGTLNMTGRVTATACTVDIDPKDNISLEPTNAAEIWRNSTHVQTNLSQVTVSLKDCGLGSSGVTPSLRLNGTLASNSDFANSKGALGYRFRNAGAAGGTAREFFIAVAKKNPVTKWDGTDVYQSTEALAVNVKPVAGDSGAGVTSTFWLGVASGNTSGSAQQSTPASARAGTVIADINVMLEYK